MRPEAFCMIACALLVAGSFVRAETVDFNALLCDPEGWKCDKRYASISQQSKHVRGNGPGLLFEYTRESKCLFDAKGRFNNQAYRPGAVKALPDLDLSGYDRLSFWLYVEGNAEEAFQWGFGSLRPFRLSCRRGEWFHARWYLEEARCDLKNAAQIIFRGVNQGSAPGDPQRAKIYLSDFKLEKTEDRVHIGWTPDAKEIILPYTGVYPGEHVTALVASEHARKVYACSGHNRSESGRVSGVKRTERTECADIQFVAPKKPGDYRLTVEGGPSATLRVRKRPYEEAAQKALRAIRAQRCGCASELHGPCHLDDAVRADTGEPVDLSGGWHDEGVSQFSYLTAHTTACLARFRRCHKRMYSLGLSKGEDDDLLAEIEWGARSLLKYELEPGVHYHGLVAPFWYHTDNQAGTGDERKINVFQPHQLSCWWRAEALAIAAGVCREPLKTKARGLAERYWRFHEQVDELYTKDARARWQRDAGNLRVTAARIGASVELYRLTGEQKYAKDAARTAERLLSFQERKRAGEGGFVGYFYKNLAHAEPYAGVNRKSQDIPGRALAELLMALPNHPSAPKWREALKLYAEGTLEPLARLNAPYGYVAAGPFHKPQTALFEGERRGDMTVYPLQVICRARRGKELLRCDLARSQLNLAAQMAAVGRALDDDELLAMAHATLRFMLGANPWHVSAMRHFGERWPENAQLPDVPGMIVGWMGITSKGLPFFDPHGAGRLGGPDRFVVKEGNTAMCGYLLEVCSYLDGARPR